MFQPLATWIFAAVLAAVVVAVAMRVRALSISGGIAAVALGSVTVGTGGWWPGAILVVFFATSSVLSKSDSGDAPGARRDWRQVIANGWGVLLGCVLYALSGWDPWLLFGIGAIAAATSDTWSSEIGRLSASTPRLVTNGKRVPPGTSGAISRRGSLASLGGAFLIAMLAAVAVNVGSMPSETTVLGVLVGITLAGIGGAMLDSLLGATVQEQRWCDSCKKATEVNPHRCGTATIHFGGVAGFNNDVVNMFCVLTGALIGLVSGIL